MVATHVDLVPVREFRDRLAPRIQEAVRALHALARADGPALGGFHDAVETMRRYEALHTQHLKRLRRLVLALMAAQEVATLIVTTYERGEELNVARLQALGRMLNFDDMMEAFDGRPLGYGHNSPSDGGARRA